VTLIDRIRGVLLQNGRFDPRQPLVVGVSGGPDSLCLLDCLHQLGLPMVVAHFDHQLRPNSAEDALKVAQMAAERGLPFEQAAGDVMAFSRQEHMSVEEAARTLRYRFLFEAANRRAAQAVAVGHTADDQVETVLMHLLRGAGLAGLKGMQAVSTHEAWDARIPLVRPLLNVWRSEIEAYCQECGLTPLIDATNQQTTYFRNKLRHELVPELQRYNPQVKEVLLRTADVLAGDWGVVEQAADQAWGEVLLEVLPGACVVDREKLRSLPIGLQRAILRRMLAALRPGLRDIDFETVERAVAFIAHPSRSRGLDLSQGLRLTWETGRLILAEPGVELVDQDRPRLPAGAELLLEPPGQILLEGGWRLLADSKAPTGDVRSTAAWEAWLDGDALVYPLVVRPAGLGERFQPFGMQGRSQKMSDFWINAGVPRRNRASWPLVYSAGQIVWVPGYRIAESVKVTEASRQVVHLQMIRG
jgi:tRNA(Ile)-lysidine synthase